MPSLNDFMQWIGSVAIQQTILSLMLLTSLMLAIEERRISVFAFFGQYILLSLLLAGRVYQPVAALKGAIGAPITAILYISATRVERRLRKLRASVRENSDEGTIGWRHTLSERLRGTRGKPAPARSDTTLPVQMAPRSYFSGMNSSFRVLVVALGAAGAYGLWQAYPIALLSPEINLASYWLMATGLLLASTSHDPLRIGVGLLTLLNGFETAYYTLNTSLMLVGLMGTAEILIALAASSAAERWCVNIGRPERG